jgi:arylsulfatase
MHEGGIRTPMLARWPGVIPAGNTTEHLSSFQDVLPTIAELVGQPVPKQNDGISFLPTLRGQAKTQKAHDYLYWEFCKGGAQKIFSQAVRKGKWKAYRQTYKTLEIFNLEEDPYETNDLSRSVPELVSKMEGIMAAAHTPLTASTKRQ